MSVTSIVVAAVVGILLGVLVKARDKELPDGSFRVTPLGLTSAGCWPPAARSKRSKLYRALHGVGLKEAIDRAVAEGRAADGAERPVNVCRRVAGWKPALGVGVALLAAGPATVEAQTHGPPGTGAEGIRWQGAVRVQGGSYGYDPVGRLPGLEGSGIWSLGLTGFPPFAAQTVGLDFHAWGVSRSYRSVLDGAADAETQLRTDAFSLGARLGLPPAWPVGVYVIGGLTYVSHTMKVDLRPSALFPWLPNTAEEEDGGWSPYGGFAVEGRYRRFALGVERRWVRTDASFDDPFSMRDLPLGGAAWLVGVSWYSGRL